MWRSRLFWRRLGALTAFAMLMVIAAEALRRQQPEPAQALALGLAFAALGSLAAAWIATRLTLAPLEQLTEAAGAIAQGRRRQRVHLPQPDEFGDLARSFNAMSRTLEEEIAQADQERQELREMFRCMAEGVIVIDAHQQVQFLDDAASRLLKAPLENAKGNKLWELLRSRSLTMAAEEALRSEEPSPREVERIAAGATALAVQGARLSGPPLRGAVLVLQVISGQRRLERMRHEFVANLS